MSLAPTRSKHFADSSSSLQLFVKIASEVHLKTPGQRQTSVANTKVAAFTIGTSLHLWNTDPSAARSDLSQIFASVGLDSLSQELQLIETIEGRLRKLEVPCNELLGFEVDITHIKSYYSLEAKNGDGSVCSICLEETVESGAVTPCGHVFHGHCIAKWLLKRTSSCPLCRSTLR